MESKFIYGGCFASARQFFFCLLESIINVNLQYEVQRERLVYINEDINYD